MYHIVLCRNTTCNLGLTDFIIIYTCFYGSKLRALEAVNLARVRVVGPLRFWDKAVNVAWVLVFGPCKLYSCPAFEHFGIWRLRILLGLEILGSGCCEFS